VVSRGDVKMKVLSIQDMEKEANEEFKTEIVKCDCCRKEFKTIRETPRLLTAIADSGFIIFEFCSNQCFKRQKPIIANNITKSFPDYEAIKIRKEHKTL
jgi:hypothetical protein